MIPGERLFLLCVVLSSVVLYTNASERINNRSGKHLLALLGYLHGYKIGQEYALQIPPYLIAPVIILPSVNQQQSVNIQQGSTDENYQESGGTIQAINPIRIVAVNTSCNKQNKTVIESKDDKRKNVSDTERLNDDYDDIKVGPFKGPKENTTNNSENMIEILKQDDPDNNTISQKMNNTITNELSPIMISNNATGNNGTSSNNTGPYPAPNYSIDLIKNITITTDGGFTENNQALPPIVDNRWQNFTLRANLSNLMSNNNATVINEPNNSVSPSENVTIPPQEKGPYPNAWYNNEAIDQLSITTNYYTNESPSPNDGWGSYSPMNELPSGFKPLAGLYYDGFLHKPLKKYAFVPQNYYWK